MNTEKNLLRGLTLLSAFIIALTSCRKETAQDDKQILSSTDLKTLSSTSSSRTGIDVHAHRGGRGLQSENTIRAMKSALEAGVRTLEMDVVISKDKKAIVSHDTYLNPAFTLGPNGKSIPSSPRQYLYNMNYEDIKRYDVGTKKNQSFPVQKAGIKASIPLLSDLIEATELHARQLNRVLPYYNIETKTDYKNNPAPAEFVSLLMDVIKKKGISSRVTVQSFDARTLEIVNRSYPGVKTSFLVSSGSLNNNLNKLTFIPDVYSPSYQLVSSSLVKDCHNKNIRIIPWTVNDQTSVSTMLSHGVDGIITDYPNLNFSPQLSTVTSVTMKIKNLKGNKATVNLYTKKGGSLFYQSTLSREKEGYDTFKMTARFKGSGDFYYVIISENEGVVTTFSGTIAVNVK